LFCRGAEDSSLFYFWQEESDPLGFVIFGVSQSSRKKKSCSRGSTPHKVGEEKGKESNGDMANLARIENGDKFNY
jgi:hypothetical protein